MELQRKISIFRDLIDLPPCRSSISVDEVIKQNVAYPSKILPK